MSVWITEAALLWTGAAGRSDGLDRLTCSSPMSAHAVSERQRGSVGHGSEFLEGKFHSPILHLSARRELAEDDQASLAIRPL